VDFLKKLSLRTGTVVRLSSENLQMKQQFWKDRERSSKDFNGWTSQSTTAMVWKTDIWMSISIKKDISKRRNLRVLPDVQLPQKWKLREDCLSRRENTNSWQIHSQGNVCNGTIKINCSNRRKSLQPIGVNGKRASIIVVEIVQERVTKTFVNTLIQKLIQ
jgi:hypothetical protein